MIARVQTCALHGVGSYAVEVEADVSKGRSGFGIIGLGDSAVREASERVQTAIGQSGLSVPRRTLINLAPAELKKEGSSFDLPIAMAVLKASKQVIVPEEVAFFGELSLGGVVKEVRGIVALVLEALTSGCKEVIVPTGNYAQAAVISGLTVIPARTLSDVVHYLRTQEVRVPPVLRGPVLPAVQKTLGDVVGQELAKRAFSIAAAGGHNVLMVGPPGCGKSMLAERFGSLLPPLSEREIIEVVQIHGVAGLDVDSLLQGLRPFRSPHHGVSEAGLIGGGSTPRPGEISLAHRGVLFLDELPEFKRGALESLRAPLETGRVTIARAKGAFHFPAAFQLLAAMNPCPCGRSGVAGASCLCSQFEIGKYLKKLSQPLLDRFDLQIELDAVPVAELNKDRIQADSSVSTDAISAARKKGFARQQKVNAALNNRELKALARVDREAGTFLKNVAEKGVLSARGYYRVLRVSRTIADLENVEAVSREHIAEAVQFRSLDRLQAISG
jgi:magnesium chelatase family protein